MVSPAGSKLFYESPPGGNTGTSFLRAKGGLYSSQCSGEAHGSLPFRRKTKVLSGAA